MSTKFNNLPKEKRDKILNGALEVFGKYEYKKATTDEIIESAGISKGLLFHYFGSKKNLYLYLYDYCVEYLSKELYSSLDMNETDFFEIIKKNTVVKLNILKEHPYIFNFIMRAYYEEAPDVSGEIDNKSEEMSKEAIETFFKNVDYYKFKENFTFEFIVNTVTWSAKGFVKEKFEIEHWDIEKICEKFDAYLLMYKQAFYKEEYL